MTKAEIRKQLKENEIMNERMIDIYIASSNVVEVIRISKNHCVWKYYYDVINNELKIREVVLLG